VKVMICLQSGLSESTAAQVSGELTAAGNILSVTWTQPPSGEEAHESIHQLTYEKSGDLLHMKRTGDNTTDLSFCGKSRTEGTLSTPYGDFLLEIETRQIVVPDELWQFAEESADVYIVEDIEKNIELCYFLHLQGQEPMKNDITIQIRLEKNGNKR